jgi:hypothetical protein
MENVEFKAMPDEEIRKLALSHQVEEWPVSLVREFALRDYRPISDRPDLIEACEGWVGKALEAASERFGKLAEDLRLTFSGFPNFSSPTSLMLSGVLAIPEVGQMEIAAPELENALVDHEMKQAFKSLAESSSVASRWTKVGAVAACVAAVVAFGGLILQLVLA